MKRKPNRKRKRASKFVDPGPQPRGPKHRPFKELWDTMFKIDRTVGILVRR